MLIVVCSCTPPASALWRKGAGHDAAHRVPHRPLADTRRVVFCDSSGWHTVYRRHCFTETGQSRASAHWLEQHHIKPTRARYASLNPPDKQIPESVDAASVRRMVSGDFLAAGDHFIWAVIILLLVTNTLIKLQTHFAAFLGSFSSFRE